MSSISKVFHVLLLPFMASSLPALAQESEPDALRILTSFTIQSMDPAQQGFWMPEFGVAELLVQYRADGLHHPWLLEAWESTDDTTWVLTLREGVAFQNGHALDAEAVVATIERQLERSTRASGVVPDDARFEASGPYEITVTSDDPFPSLPGVLATEGVFPIYDAEAVESVEGDWQALVGAGIYTGPYEVVALDDQQMLLERNEDYWQGRPVLPGIRVQFVPDANARVLAVQNGEADIALYPSITQKQVVDATPGLYFNLGQPSNSASSLVANLRRPPLDDVLLRRAINNAIDYAELSEDVLQGMGSVATGFYHASTPWNLPVQATNPDLAVQLLEEAGWLPSPSGIREKDGQPLELIFITNSSSADADLVARALQAQLSTYGIGVSLRSVDSTDDLLDDPDLEWHALLHGGNRTGVGGVVETFIADRLVTGARLNVGAFSSDEIDALYEELARTIDAQRRTEILHRMQEILITEQAYMFPLSFSRAAAVVNERYRDYEPSFNLFHVSWQTAPSQ